MPRHRSNPPWLARTLLRIVAPQPDRAFLLEDLDEEFRRMEQDGGRRDARSWYWWQAVSSIWPLMRDRFRRLPRRASTASNLHRAIGSDLAQSLRWLRRHPGTAGIVIGTLTVAFATVLAAFSIINATIVRPLPFPSSNRIVSVLVTGPTIARGVRSTSRPNFEDWRERARSMTALSACSPLEYRLTGRGEPREVDGVRVTSDFDRVLGIQPALGRLFISRDYAQSAADVVLLTNAFWRAEFAESPAVLGQHLLLDGRPHEIVGVLPELGVRVPIDRHEFWIPLIPRQGAFWEHSRGTGWLSVVGRIGDEVTVSTAQAELTAIARVLAQQYPDSNRGKTEAVLTPIEVEILGPVTPMLRVLGAALVAVLLVACGNIANLLLVSLARRRSELAIRAAIGAGGSRLARQVFGEATLMCLTAAALGLAIAPLLIRSFVALYPGELPRAIPSGVAATEILAALMLAMVSALMLGAPQAMHARRIELGRGMDLTRTTTGHKDRFLRGCLVTSQVALSFVLIVAGVSFVRTLDRLHRVDTGYSPAGVLSFTVSPSPAQSSGAAALQFYDSMVGAIRDLPGVRAAAASVAAPMTTGGWRFGIRPEGATADVLVSVNLTTVDYFDALSIRLLEGRFLTADEQRRATDVALVNAPMAQLLGGNVVGRRFSYSGTQWQIVGVVEGIRHGRPRDEPTPELTIPWHMAGRRPQAIIVRTTGDPMALLPAIAARIHAIDATAPLADVARLEDRLRSSIAAERFRAILLGTLAAIAVALAALGAYSVTAYAVARRTREYGIRLALGERPGSVAWRALAAAVVPSVIGIFTGAIIAVSSSRWIESLLYQVKALDTVTIGGSASVLLLLALLAGASSARRAAAINPAGTLAID